MFLRTILVMDDDTTYKRILIQRTQDFLGNEHLSKINEHDSPIFDLLNVSRKVGLFDTCIKMITTGCMYSKQEWKKKVWEYIWRLEDEECIMMYRQPDHTVLLYEIMKGPFYLVWWILSDLYPSWTRMCEKMSSMVCDTCLLKATDYRLKGKTHGYKMCNRCKLGSLEDVKHLIMQCPYFEVKRAKMYDEIKKLNNEELDEVLSNPQEIFHVILGKHPDNASFENMIQFWLIAGAHICDMYGEIVTGRLS